MAGVPQLRFPVLATVAVLIGRALYGPPDWLVDKFDSRDRRAFGFWTLVLSCVGAVFFGRAVLYVTVLSIIALIPNFSSETPVETEETHDYLP